MHRDSGWVPSSVLLQKIFESPNLDFLRDRSNPNFEQPSFVRYLSSLCRISMDDLAKEAQLERTYVYKIFKGQRNPSRDTVIQLAFGLRTGYEETQKMLRIAGRATLDPRVLRDVVFIWCLNDHLSLIEAQCILYDLKLPILGEGKNNG